MGIYILLIPSSYCAEDAHAIADEIVNNVGTSKVDTVIVFQNNLDRFQLLSGDVLSKTQIQRKLDKLTDLYLNSTKVLKKSGLKRFKSD